MDFTKHILPAHSIEVLVKAKENNPPKDEVLLKTVIESPLNENSFTIVAPILHGNVYPIHIDETLQVILNAGDIKGILSIPCKVIARSVVQQMSLLKLEIIGQAQKIQRRQSFRVNVFNTYKFLYKGVEAELSTKDISSSGMLCVTTFQLKKDDRFTIEFDANPLPKEEQLPEKIFRVRCRVLDSLPETEIRRFVNRVIFEGLTEAETKLLIQYLYHKQSEILHLEPNYVSYLNRFKDVYPMERRSYKDPLMFRVQIMGLINLGLIFLAFIFVLLAQPEPLYGLDYFFNYYRPVLWNANYMSASMLTTLLAIIVGSTGLLMNTMRMKRKGDQYNRAILFSLVSAVMLLATLIYLTYANDIVLFNF